MKTKHLFFLVCLIAIAFTTNAQIKVTTGGKASIGYAGTPPSNTRTHLVGNTLFSKNSFGSGAMIRGTNTGVSASTPDYTWYGDSTTGIFHPDADIIGFATTSIERMRVHSNGCVGIGTTSPKELFQLGDRFTIHNGGTKYIGYNSYYDGTTNKRLVTDYASAISMGGGDIYFNVAASSTAGSSITYTDALHIKNTGFVGIGTTNPLSMLSVGTDGLSSCRASFHNTATSGGTSVYATMAQPISGQTAYSVNGSITSGTGYAYGVRGSSYNSTSQAAGYAIGVYGQAGNATTNYNYGVAGILLGSNNGAGVYGADRTTANFVAIAGNYVGYFSGKIRTTNDAPEKPTGGSWTGYSDGRLKKDTVGFKDGLNVIRRIHPIRYKFKGIGNLSSSEIHIGVVAQEIQDVAPYCVGTGKIVLKQSEANDFSADVVEILAADSTGEARSVVNALTYNYDALIYVLINSVKQLDSTVTVLKTQETNNTVLQRQLDSLKQALDVCCNRGIKNTTIDVQNRSTSNPTIETNPEKNWLAQNKPNPFNKETVIEYNVEQEGKGSILIFDMNGKLLKTITVKIPGKGSVTITANDLAAGMYYYTLVVNDNEVDTKKMILTQ